MGKGGRPPKPEEEKRTIRLSVPVNQREYEKIKSHADQAQLSVAKWMRKTAVNKKQPSPPPEIPEVNMKTYHQLSMIGQNLNQLTRRFNQDDIDQKRLGQLQQELEYLNDRIQEVNSQFYDWSNS